LKTPKSSNIGKVFALFVMRKPIVSGWGCPFPETPVIKSIWAHTHRYIYIIHTIWVCLKLATPKMAIFRENFWGNAEHL